MYCWLSAQTDYNCNCNDKRAYDGSYYLLTEEYVYNKEEEEDWRPVKMVAIANPLPFLISLELNLYSS